MINNNNNNFWNINSNNGSINKNNLNSNSIKITSDPRINDILPENAQNSSANKSNTFNNISTYSNNSNSKITFNNNGRQPNKNANNNSSLVNNSSSKNSAVRAGNPQFRPLSDSRLYEMANQYITTDESLEKFQTRLRTKYGSLYNANGNFSSNLHVINEKPSTNPVLHDITNPNHIQNNNYINKETYKSEALNNIIKTKKVDRLSKNIASNLEYYNMIES